MRRGEDVQDPPTSNGHGHRPIRVVIADDHPVVREGLKSVLAIPEIQVVGEAASGAEAVRVVRRLKPDVAILDIKMPKMDGLQALRLIKERSPGTAVLMLTNYDDPAFLMSAVAGGAAGYMLKGASSQDLLDLVMALGDGEDVMKPENLLHVLQGLAETQEGFYLSARRADPSLSVREMDILRLLAGGQKNQEMARVLGLSIATVKSHLYHLFKKIGVSDRTQALLWATRNGLIGPASSREE
ncbi:MAG: response regulator transcription factor [Acidobacteriota bacterium]